MVQRRVGYRLTDILNLPLHISHQLLDACNVYMLVAELLERCREFCPGLFSKLATPFLAKNMDLRVRRHHIAARSLVGSASPGH